MQEQVRKVEIGNEKMEGSINLAKPKKMKNVPVDNL